ncbi:hypothetical protein NDA18_004556 [Ustilago nuda]|nr:hypothetical protein NDA18_004556 [Ustilago nuda]
MAEARSSFGEELKPILVPFKRSQRPSWSCTECARRKIKCDKKVPCQSCIKRGRAEQCRLEDSSYEVPGPCSQVLSSSPKPQSDDGQKLESSITPASRGRLSSVVSIHGDSKQESHDGGDMFLRGLSRLELQLDRIEHRLNQQAQQSESLEHLKARLNDVEEVISVLGENRQRWAEAGSHSIQNRNSFERNHEARSASPMLLRKSLQDGQKEADRTRLGTASTVAPRSEGLAALQQQAPNAQLASTDAATTLEFLTLGKDRRRGVDFDAPSSDSETEYNLPKTPSLVGQASVVASSSSLPSHHSGADSVEQGDDGRLHLLKHLRRGLPSRVTSRVEYLLRSLSDELPPANLLARPAAKSLTDGIRAVTLAPVAIRRIVAVAKEIGAWQHCSVHFPTFERELEVFLATVFDHGGSDSHDFEGYRAIDPAWLSLFYVVCSIAIHQMSEEEGAYCCLGAEPERMRFASVLLHAAMESLSLADYLVKPSVYCCQTIAILCVAGHNICGSDLLTSLLAIGIKTGQTLGLHALGRTARFLEACTEQRGQVLRRAGIHCKETGSCRLPDESPRQFAIWRKRIIDLEVGKRVWWAFTQQDYFAIAFSGCFSIVEGQYDTPLPHNCSDEDLEEGRLINREVNVLTVASKQRFTCHVAKIVCDFFEDLNKARDTPSLSLVRHHEDRLRLVTDRFKACLDPQRVASTRISPASLPSFTRVLQHYLFISVQHKILVMHRAFLSRDVSAEEKELSHNASIETARAVLHELQRGLGLTPDGEQRPQLDLQSRVHGGALWTIPYHAVAAATILALDMFKPASPSSHRALRGQEVKRALEALERLTGKSAIARRGCQLLRDLLEQSERYHQRPRQPQKRKTTDRVDSVLKRIRLPGDEDKDDAHSWFSHLSHSTTRSDLSCSLAEGVSPDEEQTGLIATASFGYGSSNLNPLAGNSTSRAGNSTCLNPGQAANSLSSMLISYNSGRSHAGANLGASPANSLPYAMNGDNDDATGWRDFMYMPHSSENDSAMQNWTTPTAPSTWLEASHTNNIAGMNVNMAQQQLAHILPALECMPDVWKLFDGTLGQSLVAFEESGF